MNRRSFNSTRRVVAITGAAGFVGRRLVDRHLALGDNIRVLTRQEPSACMLRHGLMPYRGDLNSDPDVLRTFADGADILYHCAAELRDPGRMYRVNVEGTRNLAEAAKNRIGRWVQLSSVAIYGRQPGRVVTESTQPDTERTYTTTASKLAAERLVVDYAEIGAFTYSILRPCKIYGPGMPDAALRSMARYIGRGLFFFIGKRGASANYVHVDNVVEALALCGMHDAAKGRAFNLCDGFTLEELVGTISVNLGRPVPWIRIPETAVRLVSRVAGTIIPSFPLNDERISGLTSRSIYSSDAIREHLGYRPVVSLEEGILEMVAEMGES